MTFNEKVTMKDLLSEGLYILMQQKPFEKITIKQICDKTGVIRGTFYNHFMDKYEALEYLIHRMYNQIQLPYLFPSFSSVHHMLLTYHLPCSSFLHY